MSEFKIGAGTSEDQLQQFFAYLLTQGSTGIASTGVLTGLSVQQTTTASANVLVNIGAAVTQSSLTAGADVLLNNAQKTLDVLTAFPMGATPRNDLVVFDPADATVKLVVGTPNAVPTNPTPPTGAVSLAQLSHLASATTVPTARITDLRTLTSLAEYAPAWVTLTLAGGVSGTLKYRQRGTDVDVMVDVTGTFAAGFTAISAAGVIPAAARPTATPARAVAYVGSGTAMGSIEVTTAGTLNVQCDASRTLAKVQFTYPAG